LIPLLPAFVLLQPQLAAPEPPDSWLVPALHATGVMVAMRVGVAVIWPDPFAETDPDVVGRNYRDSYTMPPRWDARRPVFESDGGPWWLNVFGHGAFGSEVHLRARTCGHGALASFALGTAASTLWEYVVEANAARPSGIDLLYTPIAGLALGETRFALWRASRALNPGALRTTLTILFDPLGELERALGTDC